MKQAWEICRYSKSKVDRISRELAENKVNGNAKYYDILADFRSSHAYPIQSMINNFRNKAFDVDKNAIVVRRLKRIPSILNKLRRQKTMRVSAMGDIGGIRIIVKNINMVNQLTKSIEHGRTKNKLVYKKDYLKNPKASGYRGIHLTYSYGGHKEEFAKYRVELQIRSQIQHSWATAVEVVGTFSRENLKASKGNKRKISDQLNLIEKLLSFSVVIQNLYKFKNCYFLLLELNINERTITVKSYPKKLIKKTNEDYKLFEQKFADDPSRDIVMVSANSIKELRKAYPNYFSDTKDFQKTLNQIIA